MEGILADLARSGALKNEAAANALSEKALGLLSGNKVSIPESDAAAASLLVSLFVEATRQRLTPDDFASTCNDYLPEAGTTAALRAQFASAAPRLAKLHSSFFVDLPHVVGVSSSVQHHVRDFAAKADVGEERPRSVANFVFALDLAARGVAASSSVGDDDSAAAAAPGDVSQVVFQCTGEQAAELAATLRAAAGAIQRTEGRLQQQ